MFHVNLKSLLVLTPEVLKLCTALAERGGMPSSLRCVAVGGAPVAASLLAAARHQGLPVYQGYGLSAAGSVVAMNGPGDDRPGSVGRPLPHSPVRLADDGEILLRGADFGGYLGGTVLDRDDWLASGDLGRWDAEGFLYVIGRKKSLIVTSTGRNVSPEWVEAELLGEAEIAQAAVFGDAPPILPRCWSRRRAAVARVNARLPEYARVQGQVLLPEPFAAAEISSTGKPRRAALLEHHHDAITACYEVADAAVL